MWNFGPKLDLGKFEPTIMDFYYIGYAYNQCKCNIFYEKVIHISLDIQILLWEKKWHISILQRWKHTKNL